MHIDLSEIITPQIYKDMWLHLVNRIELIPTDIPNISVSEYAETRRVLPTGTPFPGPWSNERTPYLTEIMDNMSVISPISHQAVMKGAQIGLTTAAENVLGYWMDASPAEIMFISATEDLLANWAAKRLEPMIDSCGFRSKIFNQSERKGARSQADKALKKEFIGGTLNMVSAQSAPSLRSDSKRVLIRDEIDGAPEMLRTGEGKWLEVSEVRTNAWGSRKKIFDFSTPTTWDQSAIRKQYERGDQRRFMVPCPHCGGYQYLKWGSARSNHGMRGETEAGQLCDVYYLCEHCREPIRDNHKQFLLNGGYWEPTARPEFPNFRSYHLPSTYSPAGMLTWWEMWTKYKKAMEENDMRAFVTLYLGEPYREVGERPKLNNVIELRSPYRRGTIPSKDVLFLTAAVDVQRGSDKSGGKGARLEMEVCGHGADYATWSIDYRTFYGDVDDPGGGAWRDLHEFMQSHDFIYEREDGRKFAPIVVFVDSGYSTDIVYAWCRGRERVFATKGTQFLKKKKDEEGDVVDGSTFKRFRINRSEDLTFIMISTNFYKGQIYNNLNATYRNLDDRDGRWGACHFPADYPDEYFAQLTAEEKRENGSFHKPSGRANEALDLRAMNLCASDFYLGRMVDLMKQDAKTAKVPFHDIQKINHRLVLAKIREKVQGKPA